MSVHDENCSNGALVFLDKHTGTGAHAVYADAFANLLIG